MAGRGKSRRGDWKRNMLLSTTSGLISEALSSLTLQIIMAAALVVILVYAWVSPSEDKARAIETGDYRRVNDDSEGLDMALPYQGV
ncbi:MAG TPA: hypothetical protein VGL40_08700 [Bacillota bacterium]